MEFQTNVISKEMIKPSSPTPKHLQKHQLSLLDQLAPPIFPHLVYFYQSDPKIPNSQKSDKLKISLSETLSRFYPLAGRLVGNLYVDCNDAGIPFIEAEANSHLSQVITNRDPKFTIKFVPNNLEEYALKGLCMAVQITYFPCGGVAVAYLFSHKLADGLSSAMFAKVWSGVAKYGAAAVHHVPEFNAAAYFPPRDISRVKMVEEEVVAKILAFPAAKIAALREKYSTTGRRRPSRVVALSAFIWTQIASATADTRSGGNEVYAVVHPINVRAWADPPLSENLFGNVFVIPPVYVGAGDDCGKKLVEKLEETMKAVDGEYVAWLKEGEGLLNMMNEMIMIMMGLDEVVSFISFSSLCGFPLYESDFGWGRPVRVGHGGFPVKNLIMFTDTVNGGGIEALIHLSKRDMEKFEAYLDLQIILKSNL